jgi:hypothetical protein
MLMTPIRRTVHVGGKQSGTTYPPTVPMSDMGTTLHG